MIWGIGVFIGIKEFFEGGRLNEFEGDGCIEYIVVDFVFVVGVIIVVGVVVDVFDVIIGDRRDVEKFVDVGVIVVRGGEVKFVDVVIIVVLNVDEVVGFCGDVVVNIIVVVVFVGMRERL